MPDRGIARPVNSQKLTKVFYRMTGMFFQLEQDPLPKNMSQYSNIGFTAEG